MSLMTTSINRDWNVAYIKKSIIRYSLHKLFLFELKQSGCEPIPNLKAIYTKKNRVFIFNFGDFSSEIGK